MINIDKEDLVDFIWMSYRYCIGRHTIAASAHAQTIAKYVQYMHPTEIEQTIKDIRSELTYTFKTRHNIHVDGYALTADAYSMFYKYCIKKGTDTGEQKNAVINELSKQLVLDTDINAISYREKDNILESKVSDYEFDTDIMNWIKLLNFLDVHCHKFIMLDGKETECFPYFSVNSHGEVVEYYTLVELYKDNPYTTTFISPEYMKSIEEK